MESHILFIDTTATETWVELPYQYEGVYVKADLLHWVVQGINTATYPYIQLKFTDSLQTHTFSQGGHPDALPIPLLNICSTINVGTEKTFPLPICSGQTIKRRFKLELLGISNTPASLPGGSFSRAMFWILVTIIDQKPPSSTKSKIPSSLVW